jgi:hypothetical protein
MKKGLVFVVACCTSCFCVRLLAQQASLPQAVAALQTSVTAQASNTAIQDATLNGTVEFIAGSTDETVPFEFQALQAGSARSDISLSAGTLTEIRQALSTGSIGTWSKGDGVQHSIAGHNLMTDAAWCFPLFVVQRLVSNPNAVISYIGRENGLEHFQSYEQPPAGVSPQAAAILQHLTQIDLYLDPNSNLPTQLSFTTHPDNNALIDIAVSVQFSNYQTVNGVVMPMHIQKYLNGTLAFDVQLQSATFNSGLTQASF